MDTSFALICTAAGSAVLWQASRWRMRRPRPQRRRIQSLLKPHARYCYTQLRAACPDGMCIQIDIAAARLLGSDPQSKRHGKQGKPAHDRVDFVLCDEDTLRPRIAVLMGAGDESRQHRDHQLLEKQLAAAQVPYLVIDIERELDAEELGEMIESLVENEDDSD